jgi:hypothetical protein
MISSGSKTLLEFLKSAKIILYFQWLRRMNPTVEDAFLHMLFMWLVHFKSYDIDRPKYGLLSTSLNIHVVLLSL